MKKITIFFLLFCLSALVFAQSKRDLSKARDMMSYYDYNGAMNLLEASMREATKVNLEALEALAECYRKTGELSKAERSYNWLLKTDNYSSEAHKYYGEVLMYFEQYAAAKEQFQNYLEKTGTNPLVSRLIVSCDTAMAWTLKRDSSVFKIKNENLLNTKYSEWGAIVSKDGNSLIYVSDRPSRKSTNDLSRPYRVRKPNYQEVDSVVNSNRPLRLASSAVYPLLCEDYNLGPIVYARNGKTMLYTRTSSINGKINDGVTLFERRLEIEEAVLSGNAVEKTRSFEYNKPADYSVGHPCLNLNGNILYFVSDMPGGYGGTDIYFSVRTAQGGWSSPINLGPVINTEGNEMFPTMDDEGILYFSSNGHPGYGGMDIFRAKGYRNNWTAIENLRAPINSGGDDFYLVFDGKENGFFASNRRGGLGGDDIYSFHLMGDLPDIGYIEAPKQFFQSVEKKRRGLILEEGTETPIDSALLCIINKATKKPIYTLTDTAGIFVVDLDEKANYTLSCIKDGYVPIVNYEFSTGFDQRILMRKLRSEAKPKPAKDTTPTEEVVIRDNIVLDVGQGTGIEYSVQVLASKEYPDWAYMDKAKEMYPQHKIYYGSFPDAFTRFTIGRFKQVKEANQLKEKLREIGYHDAFVVMFEDGKRKVISYQ